MVAHHHQSNRLAELNQKHYGSSPIVVRYAVVTGSNKGIGFETVRQLASKGITVVLTARDEKRGLEAVEKLKASGVDSELLLFHQLDITDPPSVSSLAAFIKTQLGKLDILVNNAGIVGVKFDMDAFKDSGYQIGDSDVDWSKICIQTYELALECLKTNYYGTKQTCEALLPLLELSDSPRIVNLSSYVSALKDLPEKARAILGDAESLTEDGIEMVLKDYYLKDYEEGELANRGWCPYSSAYKVSKAVLNAYTRVLAKRYPKMRVNCVCPGFVKTDINMNGVLSAQEGAESPVRLALLPEGGPTGRFFLCKEEAPF